MVRRAVADFLPVGHPEAGDDRLDPLGAVDGQDAAAPEDPAAVDDLAQVGEVVGVVVGEEDRAEVFDGQVERLHPPGRAVPGVEEQELPVDEEGGAALGAIGGHRPPGADQDGGDGVGAQQRRCGLRACLAAAADHPLHEPRLWILDAHTPTSSTRALRARLIAR